MNVLRKIESLFIRIKKMTSIRLALAIGAIFETALVILFAVCGISWSGSERIPITGFGWILAYIQIPGLWVGLRPTFLSLPGTVGLSITLILIIGINFFCSSAVAYGLIYIVRWLRAGPMPYSDD
jgi:hypothetical protein